MNERPAPAVPTPAPPAAPAPPQASGSRLVFVLGLCGVLSGSILVVAFESTQPSIQRHREEVEREAAREVLPGAVRVEPLYALGGHLAGALPPGTSAEGLAKVFVGYDEQGRRAGYVLKGSASGYGDVVSLMCAYEPESRRLLGLKVLESRETPGLGDRIQKDPTFATRFEQREAPIQGVKPGKGTGDAHEVDMLSGATISSRAVIRAVNEAVRTWEAMLLEHARQDGGAR